MSKPTYEELQAQVEVLRIAALNAIQSMAGGKAKADLRDAYDATPAACLAQVRAEAVSEFAKDVLAEIGAATTYQHVIDSINKGVMKVDEK